MLLRYIGIICVLLFSSYALGTVIVFPADGLFVEEFSDMPANFGNGLPYEGLRGMIVAGEPIDGCSSPLKRPPDWENTYGKFIVLLARTPNSNCTFEKKVRNAQNASYDAVIVYNSNSDKLEPMSAKNSTGIHIPSVFIGENSGLQIKMYYTNPNFFVFINNDTPWNIQTNLLLPFAIVVGICFIFMVVFMVVKCIKDRRRQRRYRLPTSALNKIPTCKFQKGDPYETCAICLDDYIEGEKLRVLPCNHVYHSKCIDPWLTKNRRVCPICKRKVFAHDETPYTDSDSEAETDDTTPLVNPFNSRSRGGTFEEQTENPFQRAARSISQQSEAVNFVTASDHHSINAEIEVDDSSSCNSNECLLRSTNSTEVCDNSLEVYARTKPGTSHDNNEAVA